MDDLFDPVDLGMTAPPDPAIVDDMLADPTGRAPELLMLYFACQSNDPDEIETGDAPERIALVISDMADDGDEEARMAMVAISTLSREDASEEDIVVGVAMLQTVASLPLLRNVIAGDLDYETAAGALSVINFLSDGLLGDVLDPGDIDDVDLDDIDFAQLASQLGVSEFDLDLDLEDDIHDR